MSRADAKWRANWALVFGIVLPIWKQPRAQMHHISQLAVHFRRFQSTPIGAARCICTVAISGRSPDAGNLYCVGGSLLEPSFLPRLLQPLPPARCSGWQISAVLMPTAPCGFRCAANLVEYER